MNPSIELPQSRPNAWYIYGAKSGLYREAVRHHVYERKRRWCTYNPNPAKLRRTTAEATAEAANRE